MPGPGDHPELRCHRQLACQGRDVLVGKYQLVAITAVHQYRHMHVGQGVTTEHQAQRRHQHQCMNARIGDRSQVIAIDDQLALCPAGIFVFRTLLTVVAQAIQIRLCARKNQRGLATSGVTNHSNLLCLDKRRQHRVAKGSGDGRGNLHRSTVEVAQGPQATVVLIVIARMQHSHDDKAFARQRGRQVMQGERRTGIAMG